MVDRLSYSDFRDEFLLAIAIAVKADTNRMINPLDVASNIEGRFQGSWPQAAMTDLARSGFISGITFISGGGSYKLTGSGLSVADDIASSGGNDLYELIDEPEEIEASEAFVIGDPDAGYVIGEPAQTRDLDQLKAGLHIHLDILEVAIAQERSMIGHNNPPEAVDPLVFSDAERRELLGAIASLRDQIKEPTPDRRVIFREASLVWRVLGKTGSWVGDRISAQIDTTVTAVTGGAVSAALITYGQQIFEALHGVATAVLEWLHMIPL